jgi:hypothetical protein
MPPWPVPTGAQWSSSVAWKAAAASNGSDWQLPQQIFNTFVWNNRTPGGSLINPVVPSSLEQTYIQNNRDYFASASKPAALASYTAYTYPHPLASGGTPPPDTTPPSTPTNLQATAVSSSQINLTWSASTDNIAVTGYKVERCQGASCTTFGQISTPTTNSFNDSGLTANTTYRYQVRAVDAAGNGSIR